jgi:hypothetical protein
MLIALSFLIFLFTHVYGNLISIYMESPTQESAYVIPPGQKYVAISVSYRLFGLGQTTAEDYEFCFDVDSADKSQKFLAFQCIPATYTSFQMNNVYASTKYTFNTVLRQKSNQEILEFTRVNTIFYTFSLEETLPSLEIPYLYTEYLQLLTNNNYNPQTMILPAHPLTHEGKLDISFTLQPPKAPYLLERWQQNPQLANAYTTCLRLDDITTQQVIISWTCLQSSDRQVSLKKLQEGHHYLLHFALRDVTQSNVLTMTEIIREIHIIALEQLPPPQIQIPLPKDTSSSHSEYHVAEVGIAQEQLHLPGLSIPIPIQVQGHPRIIQDEMVSICIELIEEQHASDTVFDTINNTTERTKANKIILPFSCLAPGRTSLSLTLPYTPGRYLAFLTLSINQLTAAFPSLWSNQTVLLDLRMMEEFVPSYEWQPLKPWHTIPSGLETRLPLSTNYEAIKEARIPEPWRLQISLPSPCSYFLRMDLQKDTTINQILTKAAQRCKIAPSCLYLVTYDHDHAASLTSEMEVSRRVHYYVEEDTYNKDPTKLTAEEVTNKKELEDNIDSTIAVNEAIEDNLRVDQEESSVTNTNTVITSRHDDHPYQIETVESINLFNVKREIHWVKHHLDISACQIDSN